VYLTPVVVTSASPVKVLVGELPKSAPAVPEAVVAPVFVIPDPARTTNELASPRSTLVCAAEEPTERLVEIATRKKTADSEKATRVLVILNGCFAAFWAVMMNSLLCTHFVPFCGTFFEPTPQRFLNP
jgi:hypothetical protein